jgi:hypothetical protein
LSLSQTGHLAEGIKLLLLPGIELRYLDRRAVAYSVRHTLICKQKCYNSTDNFTVTILGSRRKLRAKKMFRNLRRNNLSQEGEDTFIQNVPEQLMVPFSLHVLVDRKQRLELEWLQCRQ